LLFGSLTLWVWGEAPVDFEMGDQEKILTRLHDLLLYLVPVLAKFPEEETR
jgi:hypothetical protein